MNRKYFARLIVASVCLVSAPALAAFQCPAAESLKSGEKSDLRVEDFSSADGEVSDRLQATIRHMQARGAKNGDIVDHLVVADCGNIDAAPQLSDKDKADQVRRFASKVANFVYNAPGANEEAILVSLPVPTALYTQVKQAAKQAGLSADTWLNQAIVDHLNRR